MYRFEMLDLSEVSGLAGAWGLWEEMKCCSAEVTKLESSRPLDLSDCLIVARDILHVLTLLHRHRPAVVLRTLTPATIFLDASASSVRLMGIPHWKLGKRAGEGDKRD